MTALSLVHRPSQFLDALVLPESGGACQANLTRHGSGLIARLVSKPVKPTLVEIRWVVLSCVEIEELVLGRHSYRLVDRTL